METTRRMADLDFLIFSLPPSSHTSLPPLRSFHFFIHLCPSRSLSLSHEFVPEFNLARPRFDLLISLYKQVQTHTHPHSTKTCIMHTYKQVCTQTKAGYIKLKYNPSVRLHKQICQVQTPEQMVLVRMPLFA